MVFKYCHGGIHWAETKLFVKRLFAWIGVKDDFFMSPGKLDQFLDYGLSQTQPLKTRVNGHIAQVRTVRTISQSPTHRNNFIFVQGKTFEFAVAKYKFKLLWVLFSKRSDFIQFRQFVPIDIFLIVFPLYDSKSVPLQFTTKCMSAMGTSPPGCACQQRFLFMTHLLPGRSFHPANFS